MPPRSSGKPNKITSLRSDAIIMAAENAGNKIGSDGMVSYLETQANENPGLFAALLGRVLPLQLTGADNTEGNPTAIQITIVDPKA